MNETVKPARFKDDKESVANRASSAEENSKLEIFHVLYLNKIKN
jgi:hypothetical protein